MIKRGIISIFAATALSACTVYTGSHDNGAPPPAAYQQPPPVAYQQPPGLAKRGSPPPGLARRGGPQPGYQYRTRSVVEWHVGGPPPWVAGTTGYDDYGANDYRKKRRGTYYLYAAPYGIQYNTCYHEQLGQALGGLAGAAVGSQIGKGHGNTAAIIGGAIVGMLVGGHIGRSMDEVDQNCIGQILEHAPPNQTVNWQHPQNGGQYQVTPQQPYNDQQGRYCREYQTTATIDGQPQQAYGTACRQPDGSWQIVS